MDQNEKFLDKSKLNKNYIKINIVKNTGIVNNLNQFKKFDTKNINKLSKIEKIRFKTKINNS